MILNENYLLFYCPLICLLRGEGKHSAFVRQSLDIRGKNTEAYNNSCVSL